MNASLISLELAVVLSGLAILMIDLWIPADRKRLLGYFASLLVAATFVFSFTLSGDPSQYAFGQSYVIDSLSLFFKRFFLIAGCIVLLISVEFSDRIESG